ncbi:MAG: MBL fold metallo-hydrolase [bacterium]|nr:MBL fold metallo-hydrolase [bacterium]
MEISYLGHSAFKIRGKDTTLVIDPFDPEFLGWPKGAWKKQEADVVLVTHPHHDHDYVGGVTGKNGQSFIINGAGEYEVGGVRVFGIPCYHDRKQGKERGNNTIYLIEIDGFSLVHLGDLGHPLDDKQVEDLSTVDILFVPVGGVVTINAEAATEVIAKLEPSFVIPMHYQEEGKTAELESLEKFLKAMGKSEVRRQDKLKVSIGEELPEETAVVVLEKS